MEIKGKRKQPGDYCAICEIKTRLVSVRPGETRKEPCATFMEGFRLDRIPRCPAQFQALADQIDGIKSGI